MKVLRRTQAARRKAAEIHSNITFLALPVFTWQGRNPFASYSQPMPELPEVETIARTLSPQVLGQKITGAHVLNPGSLEGVLPLASVLGQRIAHVGRRGKLLLLQLEPDKRAAAHAFHVPFGSCASHHQVTGLALHLKMTGRVFVYAQGTAPGPHTRVILDLENHSRIFFDDARKFGYVRVLNLEVLAQWPFWNHLGPEPLDIAPADFVPLFQHRRGRIKALLLDQKIIAGVGNIYADESLFRAGIRPDAQGHTLSTLRLTRLHHALQEVLRESIAACGSSIRDYRTARGDAGAFQNAFRVYGRSGQQCLHCATALESTRTAGRATVFCPMCQKA